MRLRTEEMCRHRLIASFLLISVAGLAFAQVGCQKDSQGGTQGAEEADSWRETSTKPGAGTVANPPAAKSEKAQERQQDPAPASDTDRSASRRSSRSPEPASDQLPREDAIPIPDGSVLEITSISKTRGATTININGTVKNISREPLVSVQLFIHFEDEMGNLVETVQATLGSPYLKPRHTSTFALVHRWSPPIRGFRLEFKDTTGNRLRFRVQRSLQ